MALTDDHDKPANRAVDGARHAMNAPSPITRGQSSRLGVIAVARGNIRWRADSGIAEASHRDQLVWATRSNGLHCETIYRFQILRLILGIALRSLKQFKMRRDQLLPDFGHICSIPRCAAVTVFQVNFRYVPSVEFTGGDF